MNNSTFCKNRVLASALLAISFVAHAQSDFVDLRRIGAMQGDAKAGEAKITVCIACHGVEGNAIVPLFPVLAGQRADYTYAALLGFQRRNDPTSAMTAQVKELSDADLRNIAVYFAGTARRAAAPVTGDARLVSAGEQLFRAGDASKGIPPCQGCHGAQADGHPLAADAAFYRLFPILRGQHADYLFARLLNYRDGKTSDTSNARIMRGVAQNIDDSSARAISAWASQLPE
jgi:cytochrome c553